MPYPAELSFALEELFKSQYLEANGGKGGFLILKEQDHYQLIETKDSGYSKLDVSISRPNLCITAFDMIPVWGIIDGNKNGMAKGVDHVLLSQKEDGTWKAYLIEMKTNMGARTFEHVRAKVRSNYFSIKALCVYLGITLSDDLEVIVTYKQLVSRSDPAMLHAKLGTNSTNVIVSEWNNDSITIQIPEDLSLRLVRKLMKEVPREGAEASGSATVLVGSIQL